MQITTVMQAKDIYGRFQMFRQFFCFIVPIAIF